MEDRIPGGLQHHHKMCYEKGGYHGRQACMIWRWFHRGMLFPDEWTYI